RKRKDRPSHPAVRTTGSLGRIFVIAVLYILMFGTGRPPSWPSAMRWESSQSVGGGKKNQHCNDGIALPDRHWLLVFEPRIARSTCTRPLQTGFRLSCPSARAEPVLTSFLVDVATFNHYRPQITDNLSRVET